MILIKCENTNILQNLNGDSYMLNNFCVNIDKIIILKLRL